MYLPTHHAQHLYCGLFAYVKKSPHHCGPAYKRACLELKLIGPATYTKQPSCMHITILPLTDAPGQWKRSQIVNNFAHVKITAALRYIGEASLMSFNPVSFVSFPNSAIAKRRNVAHSKAFGNGFILLISYTCVITSVQISRRKYKQNDAILAEQLKIRECPWLIDPRTVVPPFLGPTYSWTGMPCL